MWEIREEGTYYVIYKDGEPQQWLSKEMCTRKDAEEILKEMKKKGKEVV